MPEAITLPTLSKIGLKMDCGIELNAKTVARFIPYGMILLRVKATSKKANKYTFWFYNPRFWLKNIPFVLFTHVETLVQLSQKKPDSTINVKIEFGEREGELSLKKIAQRIDANKPKEKVTYKMIQDYIEEKYGFKVHTAYIAEVKRDLGLPMYDAPNAVEELKRPRSHPTTEMVEAIKDALKYFAII